MVGERGASPFPQPAFSGPLSSLELVEKALDPWGMVFESEAICFWRMTLSLGH